MNNWGGGCIISIVITNNDDDYDDWKLSFELEEELTSATAHVNQYVSSPVTTIDGKKVTIEVKKSDADVEAAKWQLLFYLSILKSKGVIRKGKLEFVEKNKKGNKVMILELTEELELQLNHYISAIEKLLEQDEVPECIHKRTCKECAYYEYCYI